MGVRIRNTYYSNDGNLFKVEIVDSDFSGTITSYVDQPVEITWADESDNFLETIKSSSARYILYDDGGVVFNAFREDLVSAQENEFQLALYKWNSSSYDLYWVGVIMPDMVTMRNESAPRELEIIAKDGLNRINTIVFNNIDSTPFDSAAQTFMYIVEKCLAKNGLASFHTGDYIKVSADWYDTQMTSTNPQRVLERMRIWGEMLRKDIPDDQAKKTDVDPLFCGDVLKSLLKLLACRIIYSEGAYHIQQVRNFASSTYNVANYDSTGTFVDVDSSVSNQVSVGASLKVLENGLFGWHAAYKRVKLTARGYLDVRGAYIDKIEVNRSDTSNTQTLQLGTIIGGVYATGTKTTSGNTNTFRAVNAGTAGNSIALVFNGIDAVGTVVNDWNTANPTNQVFITSGVNTTVHTAGTTTLSGGAGNGNRYIEIDFDVQVFSNSKVKGSNILTTIDVKLICGSYRIKNRTGYPNQNICDWSTTSGDKWTYAIQGYDNTIHKIALITPEIPFEEETNCTAEITITLTKKDGSSWTGPTTSTIWPQTDWDFYSTLRRGRVIAWDEDIDTLGDVEVITDNPTNTANSVEYDFGEIIIGDNPIVQKSVSTKNSFEIFNSLGTWKRPNVWEAGFDTDVNLVSTMLMEAMSLRKSPVRKYMGAFTGTYAAHKAIVYDSTTWALNMTRYDTGMDEWYGSWFEVSNSRQDIILNTERYKPSKDVFGLPPYKITNLPLNNDVPLPINPKGKSAAPYEQGASITTIGVDTLDNNHLMEGDNIYVYQPGTNYPLQVFVVDADTSVSDTSISVISDTADADIPVGAIIEHNSKELVSSDKIRSKELISMGGQYVNVTTDSTDGNTQYTVEQYVILVDNDGGGLYNKYLPLIADCSRNGQSQVFIIKRIAGIGVIKPHTSDSAQIHHGGSLVASITMSGGSAYMITHDGTNWISLQIS